MFPPSLPPSLCPSLLPSLPLFLPISLFHSHFLAFSLSVFLPFSLSFFLPACLPAFLPSSPGHAVWWHVCYILKGRKLSFIHIHSFGKFCPSKSLIVTRVWWRIRPSFCSLYSIFLNCLGKRVQTLIFLWAWGVLPAGYVICFSGVRTNRNQTSEHKSSLMKVYQPAERQSLLWVSSQMWLTLYFF